MSQPSSQFLAKRPNLTVKYTVIIEQGKSSWGAYVPDLPGCTAAAHTREEVVTLIQETIEFQLAGLQEQGEPIPEPHSFSEVVEVN